MGSTGSAESGGDDGERDDKYRVEQSRVPAPPSGFSRIDSLDDLDDYYPPRTGGTDPGNQVAAAGDESAPPAGDPTSATPAADDPTDVTPTATERRSHRWNRKPSISAETPMTLDGASGAEAAGPDEYPPLPLAALNEPPLPETVPTEAVQPAAPITPPATVAGARSSAPDQDTAPARTGEPYEEQGESLRSRRITELEDDVAELRRLSRRGTLDLGLLLLRLSVGAYLAVDGARKLFGWLDGPSLNGFETTLLNTPNRAIGFDEQSAGVVAMGWSVTQLVVGILLIAGFLTPLAGAFGLAVASLDLALGVTVAGGVHLFADQKGSVAVPAALVVLLVTIMLCGPGRYSLDGPRRWARRPSYGSVALVLIGIGIAVLVWLLFNGTNPLASPGNPG